MRLGVGPGSDIITSFLFRAGCRQRLGYLEDHGPQLEVDVLDRVTVPQQADALHVEPKEKKKGRTKD